MPMNKLNQGGEGPVCWKLQDIDEGNFRWSKKWKDNPMLLDWEN